MIHHTRQRTIAFVAGGSAIAAPIAFIGGPALGIQSECSGVAGATEVAEGVCEMRYDSAGDYEFTAPEGVSKVAALIVGGGGGAFYKVSNPDESSEFPELRQIAYAGGGGDVIMMEYTDFGTRQITVGAGGSAGTAEDEDADISSAGVTGASGPTVGGNSSVGEDEADGGGVGDLTNSAASGSGNSGEWQFDRTTFDADYASALEGSGGGGAGDWTYTWDGGPGWSFHDFKDYDVELFPEEDGDYGQGGSVVDETTAEPILSETSLNIAADGHDPLSGEGGSIKVNRLIEADGGYLRAADGEDGMVVLRWLGEGTTEDDDALPETGAAYGPWTLVAALASVVGGLGILSRARRRTNI